MDKYNRKYKLEVQTYLGTTITIELPFTIEFDITRNNLSSANVASIRIYNLSEKNRNLLRKDSWDYNDIREIVLKAGYEGNMPVVFKGNMTSSWSVREGTNFITQIESFGGGAAYNNAITDTTYPAGTTNKEVMGNMISSMPGVALGAIGEYDGSLARGAAYSGATCDVLTQLSGGGFFIDNGIAHCLQDGEYIEGPINIINSQSGLLGTPVREQTFLNFDMLFEPQLLVGQRIKLESVTGANFNGYYKVNSVKHKGMISEAVSGSVITSVGLIAPINMREVRF